MLNQGQIRGEKNLNSIKIDVLAIETANVAFQSQNGETLSPLHSGVALGQAGCSESGLCLPSECVFAASQQTSLLARKQLSRHYTSKE